MNPATALATYELYMRCLVVRGSGTLKIISTCKEAGLPDPEIIEQDGGILVTLFKNKYSADQIAEIGIE